MRDCQLRDARKAPDTNSKIFSGELAMFDFSPRMRVVK